MKVAAPSGANWLQTLCTGKGPGLGAAHAPERQKKIKRPDEFVAFDASLELNRRV